MSVTDVDPAIAREEIDPDSRQTTAASAAPNPKCLIRMITLTIPPTLGF
jgi:hypothetical protein